MKINNTSSFDGHFDIHIGRLRTRKKLNELLMTHKRMRKNDNIKKKTYLYQWFSTELCELIIPQGRSRHHSLVHFQFFFCFERNGFSFRFEIDDRIPSTVEYPSFSSHILYLTNLKLQKIRRENRFPASSQEITIKRNIEMKPSTMVVLGEDLANKSTFQKKRPLLCDLTNKKKTSNKRRKKSKKTKKRKQTSPEILDMTMQITSESPMKKLNHYLTIEADCRPCPKYLKS